MPTPAALPSWTLLHCLVSIADAWQVYTGALPHARSQYFLALCVAAGALPPPRPAWVRPRFRTPAGGECPPTGLKA